MQAPSATEPERSYSMIRSPQPQTISCIYATDVRVGSIRLPKQPILSLSPDMVGRQFGWVKILTDRVYRPNRGEVHALVRCTGCFTIGLVSIHNLAAGKTRGCQKCSQPRSVPKWLDKRVTAMKQRCTNPNDRNWYNYGARGVQFQFDSVLAAGRYIMETLGLHRDLDIDRTNNNGHYAPGNLRYVSHQVNIANRRCSTLMRMHDIRTQHPEVRYADNTLRNLFSKGLTVQEVVARWAKPSCKPKGVYGTFSTPDPAIVSLLEAGSSPTANSG